MPFHCHNVLYCNSESHKLLITVVQCVDLQLVHLIGKRVSSVSLLRQRQTMQKQIHVVVGREYVVYRTRTNFAQQTNFAGPVATPFPFG